MPVQTSTIDASRCKPDVLDRFWSKVDRPSYTMDQCWEWQGLVHKKTGRPMFHPYHHKSSLSHRFIDFAMNGEIPDGILVLHKCDNILCVRPSHLFRGTSLDVGRKGELSHKAKLTATDVINIRHRRKSGEMAKTLAAEYGLASPSITYICSGKNWPHIREGLD